MLEQDGSDLTIATEPFGNVHGCLGVVVPVGPWGNTAGTWFRVHLGVQPADGRELLRMEGNVHFEEIADQRLNDLLIDRS